jgi:hypothetical protein
MNAMDGTDRKIGPSGVAHHSLLLQLPWPNQSQAIHKRQNTLTTFYHGPLARHEKFSGL